MRTFDFVVLGGGISGLGFAKRMSDNGASVLVLEKEDIVGGLSRSIHYKGHYLDYSAHRFHTKNQVLLDEIMKLPGLEMHQHIKKSRIYMFGRYLKYPFEIQNLLRAMPLKQSFLSGLSFVGNMIRKQFRKTTDLRSYKDWFVYIYGERLYEVMCNPYTSKIWQHDPAEISADWADQRFQGEDMAKLVRRILKKILRLDFSNYNLEDDSLAPDGGPFYYPLRGIQELPDAMALAARQNGAEILTSATITSIDTGKKTVTYLHNDIEETVGYKHIISTIPLHTLYQLQERKDAKVEQALAGTRYMDIIFVYLFLDKKQVSNDHWLYFPDKNIIFNRAVEFSNWSPVMCPEGTTSICFDITSFSDSPAWAMTDEELTRRVIEDAIRINYIEEKDITDHLVVRISHAYPYYDLEYKSKLDVIVPFLESGNVHLLGRTGVFRYNNSDNSIEMGFELADQFLAGKDKATVYNYSIKAISY